MSIPASPQDPRSAGCRRRGPGRAVARQRIRLGPVRLGRQIAGAAVILGLLLLVVIASVIRHRRRR